MNPGRRAHYGTFYGADIDGPVAVVWGNCQAEAVRVVLDGSQALPIPTVRVPPVHELVEEDLTALTALLPQVAILVSQPVRDGYRGLPIGTDEIAGRLAAGAVVVQIPVIRYLGLHPYSAIVRHPSAPAATPPVVPYHDLRTLAVAAGRRRRKGPPPASLRAVAEASITELARREAGTDVAVSDLLVASGADAMHTLNHPGNGVLIEMVRRVLDVLRVPATVGDPGRELLGGVKAPLDAEVIDAHGLDAAPSPVWHVDGAPIDPAVVEDAHLRWYRQHPLWVDAGLARHADRLDMLRL